MGAIKQIIDNEHNDFELDMMYLEYLQMINEQPLLNNESK